MTNEELADRIQKGERDKLPILWEQVERFISQQAGIRARQYNGYCGVTEDDLYQSGFFALLEAVQSYNPDKGMSFIGWLAFHLRNAFRDAVGRQSDAIHRAQSLDAPLQDDEDGTLADIIPDPTEQYEAEEERIYREQLRDKLNVALSMIPEQESSTLRRRFFQNMTLKQIGELDGITINAVRKREGLGLRKLRNPTISKELRQFIEERTPYYLRVGVGRFNNTRISSVEEISILREQILSQLTTQSILYPSTSQSVHETEK